MKVIYCGLIALSLTVEIAAAAASGQGARSASLLGSSSEEGSEGQAKAEQESQTAVSHLQELLQLQRAQAVQQARAAAVAKMLKRVESAEATILESKYLRGARKVLEDPKVQKEAVSSPMWRIGVQLIFGMFYFFLIVSKYPLLDEMPMEVGRDRQARDLRAADLQDMDEVSALGKAHCPNIFHACCCTGPRAAHTFHSAGVLNYWIGWLFMAVAPCCTLMLMNSYSDLNEKLGGKRRSLVMSCLCSFFCAQCVVAQDAEALDIKVGRHTEILGVSKRPDSVPEYHLDSEDVKVALDKKVAKASQVIRAGSSATQ